MLLEHDKKIAELETKCKDLAASCLDAQQAARELATELNNLRNNLSAVDARRQPMQRRVTKTFSEFRNAVESANQRSS